jgi:hypothetical protein
MKIIITENKLNVLITKWLDNHYGDCGRYVLMGGFDRFFYKNEQGVIFVYQMKGESTLFVGDVVSEPLENKFGINDYDASSLLQKWFSKKYNLHPDKTIVGSDLSKFSELYDDKDYQQF